jgi:glucose dehydrogenase
VDRGREMNRRRFLAGVAGAAAAVGFPFVARGGSADFDVCVIGSGFAGVFLALRLARRGLRVGVVEAGRGTTRGLEAGDPSGRFRFVNTGQIAYDVNASRSISVGGTSLKWTGNVTRLSPSDFEQRSTFGIGADWPLTYDELAPYYCEAEEALSTVGHPFVDGAEPPRSCPYPTEKRGTYRGPARYLEGEPLPFFRVARSVREGGKGPVRLFEREIPQFLALPGARLLSNRQVTRLVTLDGATVDHAVAIRANGLEEQIRARTFVVAAGVVESARLLLLSRSTFFPDGLGNGSGLVGRHFNEHPSTTAIFEPRTRVDATAGTHRTYYYNDRLRGEGVDAAHLQLTTSKARPEVSWKLQPQIEARPENRVTLADSDLDPFGNPIPSLAFGYSDLDRTTFERGTELYDRHLASLARDPASVRRVSEWRMHPAGTCRMAESGSEGVVDGSNRVFGVENLYVSGACVFPAAGTANPTLTVVALTLRLADHLAR